ncbi:MAG TPA: copper chaperone PCu(A)C [Casimicrobiaceae bacterium]|jgi:copper(I)-binding protein
MPAGSRRCAAAAAHVISLAARTAAFAALVLVALPSSAHDYTLGALKIDRLYARPTPPGARTGGVYLTIRNTGKEADQLVSAKSPAAQGVEIHSMQMEGNLMKMRAIRALDIPAGGEVTLGSGGYHVMLVGLSHPLAAGNQVPVTLTFAKAGSIDVLADVEPAPSAGGHTH